MIYRNRWPVGPAVFLAFAITVISALTFSKSATAQFYHEWNGGTGNWLDPSNWSTDMVPGSGTVDIGYVSGGFGDVTINSFSPMIENLFIGSNATLNIESSLLVYSLIENEGELSVFGSFEFADLFNNGQDFRLEGGGNIQMNGGDLAIRNIGLINEDNSIRGFGAIQTTSPNSAFTNHATISASVDQQRLYVFGRAVNDGVMESVNGGILHFTAALMENTQSSVIRSEAGSQLVFRDGTTLSGGIIDLSEGTHEFDDVQLEDLTIRGQMMVATDLMMAGRIRNEGVIQSSNSSPGVVRFENLELEGGGVVDIAGLMGDQDSEFWNVDNHVTAQTIVTNQLRNDHILESDGGQLSVFYGTNRGTIRNFNIPFGVIDNEGGVVEVDLAEGVNVNVIGGVVRGNAPGDNPIPISGRLQDVHFEGNLSLGQGQVVLIDSISSSDPLELSSLVQLRVSDFDPDSLFEFQGDGFLDLNNFQIVGEVPPVGIRNEWTISGAGSIVTSGIQNLGVIEVEEGTLGIQVIPTGGDPRLLNSGIYRAGMGGRLVTSGIINSPTGRVISESGGVVEAEIVRGGTLEGDGIFLVNRLEDLVNFSTVEALNGNEMVLSGHLHNEGTITTRDNVDVSNQFSFSGAGELVIQPGSRLAALGSSGSESHFENGQSHTIRGGGEIRIVGDFENHGIIRADSSDTLQIRSSRLVNFGEIVVSSSDGMRVDLEPGQGPGVMANRGRITIFDSVFDATNIQNHLDGLIEGNGAIFVRDELDNYGKISPGNSSSPLGTLVVSTGLTLNRPGMLSIDLATVGTETVTDLIEANLVHIDGTLEILADDGLVLEPYETLTIVDTAVGVSGQFHEIENVVFDSMFGLAITYDANSVMITPALLGDANLDGSVDTSDFNLWNDNKFSNAGWSGGDFNGDGVADTTDFNLWNGNKFTSIAAVPEPKAGLLMLGGFVILMFLSQRR